MVYWISVTYVSWMLPYVHGFRCSRLFSLTASVWFPGTCSVPQLSCSSASSHCNTAFAYAFQKSSNLSTLSPSHRCWQLCRNLVLSCSNGFSMCPFVQSDWSRLICAPLYWVKNVRHFVRTYRWEGIVLFRSLSAGKVIFIETGDDRLAERVPSSNSVSKNSSSRQLPTLWSSLNFIVDRNVVVSIAGNTGANFPSSSFRLYIFGCFYRDVLLSTGQYKNFKNLDNASWSFLMRQNILSQRGRPPVSFLILDIVQGSRDSGCGSQPWPTGLSSHTRHQVSPRRFFPHNAHYVKPSGLFYCLQASDQGAILCGDFFPVSIWRMPTFRLILWPSDWLDSDIEIQYSWISFNFIFSIGGARFELGGVLYRLSSHI